MAQQSTRTDALYHPRSLGWAFNHFLGARSALGDAAPLEACGVFRAFRSDTAFLSYILEAHRGGVKPPTTPSDPCPGTGKPAGYTWTTLDSIALRPDPIELDLFLSSRRGELFYSTRATLGGSRSRPDSLVTWSLRELSHSYFRISIGEPPDQEAAR